MLLGVLHEFWMLFSIARRSTYYVSHWVLIRIFQTTKDCLWYLHTIYDRFCEDLLVLARLLWQLCVCYKTRRSQTTVIVREGKLLQLGRAATEKRRMPGQVQFCVSEWAAIPPKASVDCDGAYTTAATRRIGSAAVLVWRLCSRGRSWYSMGRHTGRQSSSVNISFDDVWQRPTPQKMRVRFSTRCNLSAHAEQQWIVVGNARAGRPIRALNCICNFTCNQRTRMWCRAWRWQLQLLTVSFAWLSIGRQTVDCDAK